MSQPVQTTSPALILTAECVVLTAAAAAAVVASAAVTLRAAKHILCSGIPPSYCKRRKLN